MGASGANEIMHRVLNLASGSVNVYNFRNANFICGLVKVPFRKFEKGIYDILRICAYPIVQQLIGYIFNIAPGS